MSGYTGCVREGCVEKAHDASVPHTAENGARWVDYDGRQLWSADQYAKDALKGFAWGCLIALCAVVWTAWLMR